MSNPETFAKAIQDGYKFEGESFVLGGGLLEGNSVPETHIKIPLRTVNRHGLIAGATGSGKTKTVQVLSECLSNHGVPCLLMDIKGDLSGIAAAGTDNEKIQQRHERIGNLPFSPLAFPVELLTISDQPGVKLRATVSEFGPILFSKMLGLNDTQSGIVSIIFKYADDNKLPLLDLKDFKKLLNYITNEAKEKVEADYGSISTASTGTILRKVVELEQQKADKFFGEPSFEVEDLTRLDENGKGMISVLRLNDIQDRPKLFSTFMLCLLAEIYQKFPEEGDVEKPKLCLFIDEAHLVFDEGSEALHDQLESIIKLIRSKGVGIFFVTQNPNDIPDAILSQLGMKVQHALRAFTAKDRKAIKQAAQNYPLTDFYQTEDILTNLGIGEALVTALDESGRPTPLAHTLLRAPQSRMDVLSASELDDLVSKSEIAENYNKDVDRESAYEILNKKIDEAQSEENQKVLQEDEAKATKNRSPKVAPLEEEETSVLEKVGKAANSQVGRMVVRGLLGALGIRTPRRRGFF